jgi:hypothetical protein
MPSKKIITYTDLLNDIYYRPKDIDNKEVLQLLRQAEAIPKELLPFKGIIHVIDYTQRRHVGLRGPAKAMTGLIQTSIGRRIGLCDRHFSKDDFKIYNETIFQGDGISERNIPG